MFGPHESAVYFEQVVDLSLPWIERHNQTATRRANLFHLYLHALEDPASWTDVSAPSGNGQTAEAARDIS